MKRYNKKLFITMVIVLGLNCLISAYSQDITETIAWCFLLLSAFRDKSNDKEIDELREWGDYWYKMATGKTKEADEALWKEVRDAD
jgi:hypothetical protein